MCYKWLIMRELFFCKNVWWVSFLCVHLRTQRTTTIVPEIHGEKGVYHYEAHAPSGYYVVCIE